MQTDPLFVVLSLAILIMSVVIHEVSHGFMARHLGDQTAEYQGRLTLNPLKHLDPIGSVLVPLLLYFGSGGKLTFGWAKPVPYNPYNLRDQRWGELKVALAGPASNFILASIGSIALRLLIGNGLGTNALLSLLAVLIETNLVLGLFNLIPVPPLDGSKVLFAFLPYKYASFRQTMERFGPIFVLIVVFFLWDFIYPLVNWLFTLFTGIY